MRTIFHVVFKEPLIAALVFIYEHLAFHDLGFAIILLTVLVRLVLLPLFYKGTKDQTVMQRLQPKMKAIQEEHKDNKEMQTKAILDLYREHKLNPFSGLLLLLIQLPIILALYRVFLTELNGSVFQTHTLFGILDLGEKSLVLAIIAAALQYVQAKLSLAGQKNQNTGGSQMASMGKTMLYMGPVLTLLVLTRLPSALGLYWTVSTIFGVVQQIYINKKIVHI